MGCSVYDPTLLERHVQGAGAGGAPSPADAGPRDAGPQPSPVQCGDGEVSLEEKCDIAIPAGQPGACPSECPPIADCVARMLHGSNCQAECVVLAQLCQTGDGCCPSTCSARSDADCSQRCGDGVVQEEEGETCEPDAETDAGVALDCKTPADCEDGDACTFDLLVGSAMNCNAVCSRSTITALTTGDDCCPEGATANSDGDCVAVCGNGVREAGEECDGVAGCSDCRLTLTQEQLDCLERVVETGNDCDRCACMQCAEQQRDCRASGDSTRDMHCDAIADCANENDCVRTACYCENPPVTDPFCIAQGPCRAEIDAAASSDPSGASVPAQTDDPETAIGRAVIASDCAAMNCSDVCP